MTPAELLTSPKHARFVQAVDWLCTLTAALPLDALQALRAHPQLQALEYDCERRLKDDECSEEDLKKGCREWMLEWYGAVKQHVPVP